jgi:hypothetical protein
MLATLIVEQWWERKCFKIYFGYGISWEGRKLKWIKIHMDYWKETRSLREERLVWGHYIVIEGKYKELMWG